MEDATLRTVATTNESARMWMADMVSDLGYQRDRFKRRLRLALIGLAVSFAANLLLFISLVVVVLVL